MLNVEPQPLHVAGAGFPLFTVVLGNILNTLGGSDTSNLLADSVQYILEFLYLVRHARRDLIPYILYPLNTCNTHRTIPLLSTPA